MNLFHIKLPSEDEKRRWFYAPYILYAAIFLRLSAGLHKHSGQDTPPLFGDFEAQRHWIEVALHVPFQDWYEGQEKGNELEYWGLDYPPLTAFHSGVMGWFHDDIFGLDYNHFALRDSRGNQDVKAFMRITVLVSDLLLFFTAIYKYASIKQSNRSCWYILQILLAPPFILIDHGHFQYNCVALGLVLWAVTSILDAQVMRGAALYTAAILYKQTMLYFAPAFFCTLLSASIWDSKGKGLPPPLAALQIGLLGVIVLSTVSVVVFPFFDPLQVLKRVFPFKRGVFEDYVANVWVVLSPVLKIRHMDDEEKQILLYASTGLTFFGAFGSCMGPFVKNATELSFVKSLFGSSLAFFLFSWQVHEKAILLPLLFALILKKWSFLPLAHFSLLPLVIKDNQLLLWIACIPICASLVYSNRHQDDMLQLQAEGFARRICAWIFYGFLFLASVIAAAWALVKPPERFPYLFPFLNSTLCCMYILLFFVENMLWGFRRNPQTTSQKKKDTSELESVGTTDFKPSVPTKK